VDVTVGETHAAGYTTIAVAGDVDVYTGPELRGRIFDVFGSGRHQVIIDLSAVEFLDSTGLGVLVAALNLAHECDGGLWLVCTQERMLRLFAMTGLDSMFSLYGSVDELLADLPDHHRH
jgi:anti-sigma B factor antagonist